MRALHFDTLTARAYMFQPGARGDTLRDVAKLCERGETQTIVFAYGGMQVSDRLCELAPAMLARLELAAARSYDTVAA